MEAYSKKYNYVSKAFNYGHMANRIYGKLLAYVEGNRSNFKLTMLN